jgi:hypothetical protein
MFPVTPPFNEARHEHGLQMTHFSRRTITFRTLPFETMADSIVASMCRGSAGLLHHWRVAQRTLHTRSSCSLTCYKLSTNHGGLKTAARRVRCARPWLSQCLPSIFALSSQLLDIRPRCVSRCRTVPRRLERHRLLTWHIKACRPTFATQLHRPKRTRAHRVWSIERFAGLQRRATVGVIDMSVAVGSPPGTLLVPLVVLLDVSVLHRMLLSA